MTDDWKALSPEDKAAGAVKVIKAYQSEVNALTRRARAVESSFSTVFGDFQSAVDPVPALQAGTDAAAAAAELQRSLTAAQAEVSATDQELQGLANQEVTIRSLTDRVEQLSSQLDARVAEAVSLREAELTVAHREELEAARTAEGNALRRAALAQDTADAAVKRAQQAATAQAAAAASGASASGSTAAHVNQLADELNTVTQQMHALQAQNSTLNKRLRELSTAHHGASRGGSGDSTPPSSATAAEIDRLNAELEAAKQRASAASAQLLAAQAQVHTIQQAGDTAQAALAADLEQARGELAARPSADAFHELKEELQMLQRVYFPSALGDGRARAGGEEGGGPSDSDTSSSGLSAAVLRRARQLEGTVVALRQQLDEARSGAAVSAGELETLRAQLVAATHSQRRLQKELALATGEAPGTPPRSNGAAEAAADTPPTSLSADQQLLAVLASPGVKANVQAGTYRDAPPGVGDAPAQAAHSPDGSSSPLEAETAAPSAAGGSGGGGGGGSGADLTALFKAQRDRFREAAETAEAAAASARAETEGAQVAAAQLEADNVKLYEQIRYLEAMVAGPGRGAGMVHGQGASAALVAGDAGRSASIGSALAGGGAAAAAGQRMARLAQRAGSQQGGLWDALSLLLLRLYWSVLELVGSAGRSQPGRMLRVPGALSSSGGVLPGQASSPSAGPGATALSLPGDESAIGTAATDAEGHGSRYRSKYEDSVDPFVAFKEQQREAAAASLSFFDRSALSVASSLVASGGSRTIAVSYLLAIHLAALLWLWCPGVSASTP